MKNKKGWLACVLCVIVIAGVVLLRQCRATGGNAYHRNEGMIFNTIYHFTYEAREDYQSQIEAELQRFDASLSPFNPSSIISRFNRNDTAVVADAWFETVFARSKEVWRDTGGAFDPTVSPLINAWGFGFKTGEPVTPEAVDSLWHLVGMERMALVDGRLHKDDPRMTLNFSAIAKGYAVDVVASFLRSKGVENFLVEIGGEIVARGKNDRGETWRVGIDTPDEANVAGGEIEAVLLLDNAALATSGNYRNFRVACRPHNRSGHGLSRAALSAECYGACSRLHDGRCLCYGIYGARCRKESRHCRTQSRYRNLSYLCRRLGHHLGGHDAGHETISFR